MWNQLKTKWKWRKLRIRIWQKRLQQEMNVTLHSQSIDLPVSLHVSWGPFYNGAAILDRNLKKAKIMIQIPYDDYLTRDEKEVMRTYHLLPKDLPYFILNHEIYHLIDVLSDLKQELISLKLKFHHEEVKHTANYRTLFFEQAADDFAYRCYREKRRKAC